MRTYYLEKRQAEGIVTLYCSGFRDLWTRARIRGRERRCVVTGDALKSGDFAWRPITNGSNRMDRISDAWITQLERIAACSQAAHTTKEKE